MRSPQSRRKNTCDKIGGIAERDERNLDGGPMSPLQRPLNSGEALQAILHGVTPLEDGEHVSVNNASGRITLKNVYSPIALPRFNNSAMDGYGLHHTDLELGCSGLLPIASRIWAGRVESSQLFGGSAVRITTGARIPSGVAAVVPDEDVELQDGMLRVRKATKAGANIRLRGEDINQGDILIQGGTRLDARHRAALVASGIHSVFVRRQVVVGLLSTGDELVEPGEPVPDGKIVDVNRVLLRSLLESTGARIVDLGIARDCLDEICGVISEAPPVDVLISTGGAANSETDLTSKAVTATGGHVTSLALALKPGRSIGFGRLGQTNILHLPGNPLAAIVTSLLFAVPLVNLMAARCQQQHAFPVRAGEVMAHRRGRTEYVLAKIASSSEGEMLTITKSGRGGSACLKPLVDADGLAEIPSDIADVGIGDTLAFHPFNLANLAH